MYLGSSFSLEILKSYNIILCFTVTIVPEQWTVSESQKEEQTITEHQDSWAESESHKENDGNKSRFTITPVSKLA